ncbi:MAG: ATP-binding cassette domain-containing protein [Dermatophilaceae bacterium]
MGPGLVATDLTFGYRSDRLLLNGWSAEFPPDTMTAILGRSGRGKSTLLYLLGLMLRPSRGSVAIDGLPLSDRPDRDRARYRAAHFGFVFQDAALDPTRSVLDNIVEAALYRGQPRSEAALRARELLAEFDVDVEEDQRPGQVSGGQAQRIALCRALLNRPRVVLADEPTGNLDPRSSAVVMAALRSAVAGGAVAVVVTHAPEVADLCDRVIEL